MKKWILIITTMLLCVLESQALTTEVGINYSRKKQTFDSNNYMDSESSTGSLSLYFWERIALELSYTKAYAIQQQKAGSNNAQTVYQNAEIFGADLVLVLADKTSFFQPYIKGGAAQVSKSQQIKIDNVGSYTLEPDVAIVPSYGVGLKIAITQQFGIKLGYDVWQTPIGGGLVTDDTSMRAGVTWLF